MLRSVRHATFEQLSAAGHDVQIIDDDEPLVPKKATDRNLPEHMTKQAEFLPSGILFGCLHFPLFRLPRIIFPDETHRRSKSDGAVDGISGGALVQAETGDRTDAKAAPTTEYREERAEVSAPLRLRRCADGSGESILATLKSSESPAGNFPLAERRTAPSWQTGHECCRWNLGRGRRPASPGGERRNGVGGRPPEGNSRDHVETTLREPSEEVRLFRGF